MEEKKQPEKKQIGGKKRVSEGTVEKMIKNKYHPTNDTIVE